MLSVDTTLLSLMEEHSEAVQFAMTGALLILVGLFHLIAQHYGGFYMPIVYATLVFGVSAVAQTAYRHYS